MKTLCIKKEYHEGGCDFVIISESERLTLVSLSKKENLFSKKEIEIKKRFREVFRNLGLENQHFIISFFSDSLIIKEEKFKYVEPLDEKEKDFVFEMIQDLHL